MKQWSRRAGYIVVILLWLILVSFPVIAFFLATQGQIEFGDSQGSLRLFLLQDVDNQGLGLQWTRSDDNLITTDETPGDCTRTSLRYFLWQGEASDQNTDYCQCYDLQTQEPLPLSACSLP